MLRHPNWGHPDHDACGTGFVAQLGGPPSREVVRLAVTALERLAHRGGMDADGASGDGAGLLTPIPAQFYRNCLREQGTALPERFGLGVVFIPPSREEECRAAIEAAAEAEQLRILAWRLVPTEPDVLGARARETAPVIWQFFVEPPHSNGEVRPFESRLALLRKRAESLAPAGAYFCSLSPRTVVYKGLLSPQQLPLFFADLRDPSFEALFAVFHQRYSTNTQPSWHLAQPFRYLAHNGEINTIVGNRRWQRVRERGIRRRLGAGEWFRALEENVSDSASLDNGFEIRLLEGQSPEEALLGMVPPAYEKGPALPENVRRALGALRAGSEPWDGPAALVFTDGRVVGAKLDRNGLRPLRYTLTHDGLLVVGSETGLADLGQARVAERQRLGPGEMLVADPATGEFDRWPRVLEKLASRATKHIPTPAQPLPAAIGSAPATHSEPKRVAASLGWTEDQFRLLFASLAQGQEAGWSMGDDAPPAFLSSLPRTLWDYCKQRFAQVTNPPIDPLRESHVMSLDAEFGGRGVLSSPVLGPDQLAELSALCGPVQRIAFTFPAANGVSGARLTLQNLTATPAENGARPGLILLSDGSTSREQSALPALLATAAVWKAMVAAGWWDVPLVVETGQAFDTHHIALLIAAGASAVHPYLALHFAESAAAGGAEKFRTAIDAGLHKVLSRMGISTLASYRNSHLFEVVGLAGPLCAEYFEDAAAYLGRKTLDDLLEDCLRLHAAAFSAEEERLPDAGFYRFRKGGERHANSPEAVRRLHAHVRSSGGGSFASFEGLAGPSEPLSVRDLLELAPSDPVALEEVESEQSILRRFSTQAMSLGALSPEAHRTLALAMNRLGGRSNTGEGGEDPSLYRLEPVAAHKIKQVASARFGVTAGYLVAAEELEIKMAQGSKPGEGGQLPARKVTPFIAQIRHAVPGMTLISPPPHHDIYSIEDLAQLIHDLRAVNPAARIGVKLVAGAGVGIIAAGVAKAGANVITISGHSGGTGSSPVTSIKNTGLPWELGLREAHETLERAGSRESVKLRVDGGLKFARDILLAAALGADEFGFGTAALLAIGCVMARQCHLNTCPVGIATQDESLRARFAGKPEMVAHYFRSLAGEVRERLAQLGVRSLGELTFGESRLRPRSSEDAAWLQPLLAPAARVQFSKTTENSRRVADGVALAGHLGPGRLLRKAFTIRNSDRSLGAHLSGELIRRGVDLASGEKELEYSFRGVAGQSFGAFLVAGVRLRLFGEANDYVGKGLSGGTIAVTLGSRASHRGDVLVGNTVLYGATSGQLFVAGRAGERFAVRNSGALAVVEGTGQHCCEYMTAGVVVVLDSAGFNFGAGMTGGLAYLPPGSADSAVHREFVSPHPLQSEEEQWLRLVLQEHFRLTDSPRARILLSLEGPLPLCRVQPRHLPCAIEATWKPILARFQRGVAPPPPELAPAAASVTALGA